MKKITSNFLDEIIAFMELNNHDGVTIKVIEKYANSKEDEIAKAIMICMLNNGMNVLSLNLLKSFKADLLEGVEVKDIMWHYFQVDLEEE